MASPLQLSAALGAIGAAAGSISYAVRGRSATLLAPSIWHGDRTKPLVHLTFDDGPSESTPALLDVLDRQDVKATFFLCGQNVRRLPNVARMIVERGHGVGNHTDSHPRLDFKSRDFMRRELESAQHVITDTCGVTPTLFRAPYGVRWFGLGAEQSRLGLMGAMWTVIGLDWKDPANRIAARLIAGAQNGAIFCLHDGRTTQPNPDIGETIAATGLLVPEVLTRKLCFASPSELSAWART